MRCASFGRAQNRCSKIHLWSPEQSYFRMQLLIVNGRRDVIQGKKATGSQDLFERLNVSRIPGRSQTDIEHSEENVVFVPFRTACRNTGTTAVRFPKKQESRRLSPRTTRTNLTENRTYPRMQNAPSPENPALGTFHSGMRNPGPLPASAIRVSRFVPPGNLKIGKTGKSAEESGTPKSHRPQRQRLLRLRKKEAFTHRDKPKRNAWLAKTKAIYRMLRDPRLLTPAASAVTSTGTRYPN